MNPILLGICVLNVGAISKKQHTPNIYLKLLCLGVIGRLLEQK